ncbi:tannase/feruloyl esterase family alpha/beta hydrolase [Kineobactrum salinum]|uniref:Tannase/feruloyl esterase family alpha/beta hydrolase n=1 Tax=Kineobactrum salinum TaxID=2708301 RepID=A0A6C0U5J8_9GAMM|nr:tannase/feruloyl esterase family alpha/beta hydrolase [Kineobactrum salinum]QIB67391.1 tannase/feruloyl esterase family alpha/beta hydrolase [Kineobactrum salinum]
MRWAGQKEWGFSTGARTILAAACCYVSLVGCAPERAVLAAPAGGESGAGLAEACQTLLPQSPGSAVSLVEARLVTPSAAGREYCKITAARIDSGLKFNVWLPTRDWNSKLAFIGGGGFDGVLLDEKFELVFSPSVLDDGYAIASTNGGYDKPASLNPLTYFKAEFAADPEARADFMYRSEQRALPHIKQLVEGFYGSGPRFSYFEGCSMGGHDALLLAQREPEAFDGIIARAPAGNVVGLFMQFNRIAAHMRNTDSALNTDQQAHLARAVLARCDAMDGLADGIIARPEACDFEPASLACGSSSHPHCLAPEQVALVEHITTPMALGAEAIVHPGFHFGGEDLTAGWGQYIWPGLLGYTVQGLFSDGFIRSFVAQDQNFDTASWEPERWLDQLQEIAGQFNATDPDLGALHDRGAKLILWNGTLDSSVSPRDTVNYYRAVVETMGVERADETLELFLAPGVGHCRGGPGPDRVDLMEALSMWVEQDTPPSRQARVLTRRDEAGEIQATLPLCKFPAYPRYRGEGDPALAGSYSCHED